MFIGSGAGLEATLVPRFGVPFQGVTVGNAARVGRVRAGAAILRGVAEALAALRRSRAAVIVSTGGYVSAPVVLAGAVRRVPVVLHEPNAGAGRANRALSRFAARVAVGFEETRAAFPAGKAVVTGAAIRAPGAPPTRAEARAMFGLEPDTPTLLAFGGSQGARALNETLLAALDGVAALGYQTLHQTGPTQYESRARDEAARRPRYHAVPYIEDMAAAYAAADVAICRAGASTLAEIALFGVPAIFVPLPIAGGHQRDNAAIYQRAGAADLLEQSDLAPDTLCDALAAMADPERRARMRAALAPLARPNAAEDIADLTLALAHSGA